MSFLKAAIVSFAFLMVSTPSSEATSSISGTVAHRNLKVYEEALTVFVGTLTLPETAEKMRERERLMTWVAESIKRQSRHLSKVGLKGIEGLFSKVSNSVSNRNRDEILAATSRITKALSIAKSALLPSVSESK